MTGTPLSDHRYPVVDTWALNYGLLDRTPISPPCERSRVISTTGRGSESTVHNREATGALRGK